MASVSRAARFAASPAISGRTTSRFCDGSKSRSASKSAMRGAVALAPAMFWASAVQAQCVATGPVASVRDTPSWTPAIASASSGVATTIASINAVNTAFLTQSSAFIWSQPSPQPDQQGGGVWARGIGGHFAFDTSTTAGNLHIDGPRQGSIGCNTRTMEDFAGVQVGADFARLNVNGWNLHAGLTTGYLGSQNRDGTSEGLNPEGSFHSSLQVPFVGIYGAASYGGFLFDGQVRGDFYQSEVSDLSNGLGQQHTGAQGVSVTGNVAYQYNLGSQWFIEPSAGFVWTRIHVDPLNYPGSLVTGTGIVPPWVLAVNDIDSTLGRVSVRAGTTTNFGNMMVLQPFASVGVFHDFAPAITSALTSNFPVVGNSRETYTSTITTAGIGTYGQFGLGVAAQFADTGWVGYLRGDYRKGDFIEGWTLNGGLRYQFTPDPVRGSTRMATKAPVYKAKAAYDWTGFYIGAYMGAGFGFPTWKFADGMAVNSHFAGFLGGGDIGYNYQVGKWVFGVEGSAGWTNAHGATGCPIGFFYTCEVSFNGLSTVTGRVGYAWDRLLPYVKVGAVIAQEQAGVRCNTNSLPTPAAVPPLTGCPGQTDSQTQVGWTTGVGYEFGLTRNLSARGEIMYFDLGSDGHGLLGIPSSLQRSGVMSTLGLHYRFGA